MTRIAILADIHGNIPALEAVLADIASQAVDEILIGGDLVGRGPQSSAVVHRVRELGLAAISGNHEDYLLSFQRGEIPDAWRTSQEWAAARWMAAELDAEAAAYIGTLPFSIVREDLHLVHGTPSSNRQGLGPWTSDEDLLAMQAQIEENVLVCAHTHRPLVRETDRGLAVNVGSVGLPFNRDQRAQYAVLTRGGRWGWEVELRQVPYDLAKIFAIYKATGFLEAGGATSRLLRLELEHAMPILVPFIEWVRLRGVEGTVDELEPFYRFHPPGTPLQDFFERLQALEESLSP
jgi:putative phosphoesterase